MVVSATVVAQVLPDGPQGHGQWSGPWELDLDDNGAITMHEIAHANVLPPTDANPTGMRVVFFNVPPGCPTPAQDVYGRAAVWNPFRPANVNVVIPPAGVFDQIGGSDALFCGGHTFLPDGNLLVVSGTDYVNNCPPGGGWGHNKIKILDTSTQTPQWVVPSNPAVLEPRWYPTVTSLPDGKVLIIGHTAGPQSTTATPLPLPPDAVREVYDPIAGTSILHENRQVTVDTGGPDCGITALYRTLDYPRMHVTRTRYVIHTNAMVAPPLSGTTRFLKLEPPFACTEDRFRGFDGTTANDPSQLRSGSNSVHLLYHEGGSRKEVIYRIGGSNAINEPLCEEEDITAAVDKIIDPTPQTEWSVTDDPPDLTVPRTNHNSVILLDGSILALGGSQPIFDELDHQVDCDPLYVPERYKPPELFGNPGATWHALDQAPHMLERIYHAVAGLLPDGRVFIAGGRPENWASGHWIGPPSHSVEIYRPPYLFFANRPQIVDLSDDLGAPFPDPIPTITINSTFRIDVHFNVGAATDPVRVALIRNGSITHAFDYNQRYVTLEVIEDLGVWPDAVLRVTAPEDPFVAPPGHYMLAVSGANLLPSDAVWVRIE